MIQLVKYLLAHCHHYEWNGLEAWYNQIVNCLLHILRISISDNYAYLIKHIMIGTLLVYEVNDLIVMSGTGELQILQIVHISHESPLDTRNHIT